MDDYKCPKCGEVVGFKSTTCHTPLCGVDLSKMSAGLAAAIRNSRTGQIVEIKDANGNGLWLDAVTLENKGTWYSLGGSLYCLFVIGCRVRQWAFGNDGQSRLITVRGEQFNHTLHERAMARRRVTLNQLVEER